METFLPPIEKPGSFGMKLAYFFKRKKIGKVLTPLTVHSARLPSTFGMFYGKIGQLDKKLTLSEEMVILIRQQVAQLNVCEFCIDASRAAYIDASFDGKKFDALSEFATSDLFSPAEKAALYYASQLTVEKHVKPETFAELARFFPEQQICEIIYLVATEHVFNLTNIGLNIKSDMLCDILKAKK